MGLPTCLNEDKAFKPLKFYKATWYEMDHNTPDGHDYVNILVDLEEIDYLNA